MGNNGSSYASHTVVRWQLQKERESVREGNLKWHRNGLHHFLLAIGHRVGETCAGLHSSVTGELKLEFCSVFSTLGSVLSMVQQEGRPDGDLGVFKRLLEQNGF